MNVAGQSGSKSVAASTRPAAVRFPDPMEDQSDTSGEVPDRAEPDRDAVGRHLVERAEVGERRHVVAAGGLGELDDARVAVQGRPGSDERDVAVARPARDDEEVDAAGVLEAAAVGGQVGRVGEPDVVGRDGRGRAGVQRPDDLVGSRTGGS